MWLIFFGPAGYKGTMQAYRKHVNFFLEIQHWPQYTCSKQLPIEFFYYNKEDERCCRVAIITGGATGMGRSTAVMFAEEGCDVAIVDIKMKEANETLNQVKEKGREGLAIECEVSDSPNVKHTVNKGISEFGKVDILVNSAGGRGGA
jgi:hypothetical protein